MIKPTLEEIKAYVLEKGLAVNSQDFLNHYEGTGWIVGKAPMKNWKSTLQTWHTKNNKGMTKGELEGQALQIKFRDKREDRLFNMIEKMWLNFGVSSFNKDRRIVGMWYDFILQEEKTRANFFDNFILAGVQWVKTQEKMPSYAQLKNYFSSIPQKEYLALPDSKSKPPKEFTAMKERLIKNMFVGKS